MFFIECVGNVGGDGMQCGSGATECIQSFSKLTTRTAAEQKLFILWPIAHFSRSFSLLETHVKCGADAVAVAS